MSKDIEGLFKDGFEGFEQQPKNDMWDKIVQQRQINNLTNNASHEVTPEHTFSKEFKNFESQPGERVWHNVLTHINSRRQQKKYTTWSLLLLLLIGSCSSLVWLYDNNGDGNLITGESTKEKGATHIEQKSNNNFTSPAQSTNDTRVNYQENTISEITVGNSAVKYDKSFYRSARSASALTNDDGVLGNSETPIHVSNDKIVDENIKAKNIEIITIINDHNKLKGIAESHTNKGLASNGSLIKPDSAAATFASNKKKDEKKTLYTKAEKKWWHGPSYFKYTSETNMNNEESNWKLGASVGYEWPRVKFTGNANPLFNQFRKDDESRDVSYNAQAFLVRQIGRPFLVQFGVGFISYGFKGDYQHSIYTVRDSTTPQGNIIHDTTYSYKINAQSHFRINFIELPIIFGYRFGDNRTNFDFKAGYIMQLLQAQNGYVLSPTSHQLEPIGAPNEFSANRFGSSAYLSARGNWQIMHELSVFLEGNIRYNLKPLMGGATQQQYISSVGINGGIKFHID